MPKTRIGRGMGSGKGWHTVGRGTKGQKSRSGHKSLVMFEGGNVPFFRRIPKYKGFKKDKVVHEALNVSQISEIFANGEIVSLETLKEKGVISKRAEAVKILGHGEIDKKLTIEKLPVSETARNKVIAAGGAIN